MNPSHKHRLALRLAVLCIAIGLLPAPATANPLIAFLGDQVVSWGFGKTLDFLLEKPLEQIRTWILGVPSERQQVESHLGELGQRIKKPEADLIHSRRDQLTQKYQDKERARIYNDLLIQLNGSDQRLRGYATLLKEIEALEGYVRTRDEAAIRRIVEGAQQYKGFNPEKYFEAAVVSRLQAYQSRLKSLERRMASTEENQAWARQELARIDARIQGVEKSTAAADKEIFKRLLRLEGSYTEQQRILLDHEARLIADRADLDRTMKTVDELMNWIRNACCVGRGGADAPAIVLNANERNRYYPYFSRLLRGLLEPLASGKGLDVVDFPATKPENALYFLDYWVNCDEIMVGRGARCTARLTLRDGSKGEELANCMVFGLGRNQALAYTDLEDEMRRKARAVEAMFERKDCEGE
jgi:hypothetical protein